MSKKREASALGRLDALRTEHSAVKTHAAKLRARVRTAERQIGRLHQAAKSKRQDAVTAAWRAKQQRKADTVWETGLWPYNTIQPGAERAIYMMLPGLAKAIGVGWTPERSKLERTVDQRKAELPAEIQAAEDEADTADTATARRDAALRAQGLRSELAACDIAIAMMAAAAKSQAGRAPINEAYAKDLLSEAAQADADREALEASLPAQVTELERASAREMALAAQMEEAEEAAGAEAVANLVA
jgi:hypothetical protein